MPPSEGAAVVTETKKKTTTAKPQNLPGIDLPLFPSPTDTIFERTRHDWNEYALPLTVRERVMLRVMADLKDKEDWERKVFEPETVGQWKTEALEASRLMIEKIFADSEGENHSKFSLDQEVEDFRAVARQRVVTEKLFDYCIDEVQAQAVLSRTNGFTEVMDANACAYFSDTAIGDDIKTALKAGVAPLEDVGENQKVWHPAAVGKKLDLVHPSLYPLIYGKSRYNPKGRVPLKGCVEHTGTGKRVPAVKGPCGEDYSLPDEHSPYKHQWLPCDVRIKTNGEAKITSYINNLHPDGNEGLYSAIAKVIEKSIPLWKMSVQSLYFRPKTPRIILQGDGHDYDGDDAYIRPEPHYDPVEGEWEESYPQNDYPARVLEPDAYHPRERSSKDTDAHKFDESFPRRDLQVIVKLVNIHLTPENPTYEGHRGSWHVEGFEHEHICANALYYYDSENISDSHLAFREQVNSDFLGWYEPGRDEWPVKPQFEKEDYSSIDEIYGLRDHKGNLPSFQVLGRVLTRENRLLTYPNVLQRRSTRFTLADPTKPGHRKLLALFLVDPDIRIPSTANIPPQQLSWWADRINATMARTHFAKLPIELMDQIFAEVKGFPLSAVRARRELNTLMKERYKAQLAINRNWRHEREYDFGFL